VLHTHGGNFAVTAYTLREITATLGLRTGTLSPKVDYGLPAQELAFGYHANTAETGLLLAVAPSTAISPRLCATTPARSPTQGQTPGRAGAGDDGVDHV